jgi:hypothetical protein
MKYYADWIKDAFFGNLTAAEGEGPEKKNEGAEEVVDWSLCCEVDHFN